MRYYKCVWLCIGLVLFPLNVRAETIRLKCVKDIESQQISVEIVQNIQVFTEEKRMEITLILQSSKQMPGMVGTSCSMTSSIKDGVFGRLSTGSNCGPLFNDDPPVNQVLQINEDSILFGARPNLSTIDRHTGDMMTNGALSHCEPVSNDKKF